MMTPHHPPRGDWSCGVENGWVPFSAALYRVPFGRRVDVR
jgi:hypothetical protein